jgi:hypothetical protein
MLIALLTFFYSLTGPFFQKQSLVTAKTNFNDWSLKKHKSFIELNHDDFKANISTVFLIFFIWTIVELSLINRLLNSSYFDSKIYLAFVILYIILIANKTLNEIKKHLIRIELIILLIFTISLILIFIFRKKIIYEEIILLLIIISATLLLNVIVFYIIPFIIIKIYDKLFLNSLRFILKKTVEHKQFNPLLPFNILTFITAVITIIIKLTLDIFNS